MSDNLSDDDSYFADDKQEEINDSTAAQGFERQQRGTKSSSSLQSYLTASMSNRNAIRDSISSSSDAPWQKAIPEAVMTRTQPSTLFVASDIADPREACRQKRNGDSGFSSAVTFSGVDPVVRPAPDSAGVQTQSVVTGAGVHTPGLFQRPSSRAEKVSNLVYYSSSESADEDEQSEPDAVAKPSRVVILRRALPRAAKRGRESDDDDYLLSSQQEPDKNDDSDDEEDYFQTSTAKRTSKLAQNKKTKLPPRPATHVPQAAASSGMRFISAATDPENEAIMDMRITDRLSFDEICTVLNERRIQKGLVPSLTHAAIYGRFKRVAPLIAQRRGMINFDTTDYMHVKKAKQSGSVTVPSDDVCSSITSISASRMAPQPTALAKALNKTGGGGHRQARPSFQFDRRSLQVLRDTYDETMEGIWDLVANKFNEKLGTDLTAAVCAHNFQYT